MKILQLLCFPLWGCGSGTYTRKLGEKMAKDGHKLAIITPDKRPVKKVKIFTVKLPFFAAFTGHSEHPGCKRYSELTNEEITDILTSFYRKIIETVENFRPDIIFVHHASFLTWIANYIKVIYRIPYIVIEHGTGILNSSLDHRYFPLTRDALNRADRIICVSGDTKKWLLKVYGKRYLKKIKTIPGGVDLEAYNNFERIKIINKKYDLKNKKIVIFVGKLTQPKGVIYLVKAAPKIKGEIFILGEGDEGPKLKQYIEEKNIKNVHLLGYFGKERTKELKEFYRRADVLVVPSIWDEPLGLVVLEAMASGTVVVASKKGGIPLAVKDGVNGFLVRARSSKAIAQAVNKILQNPILTQKMATAAMKTVKERFDWLLIARRFEDIAEDIVDFYRQKKQKDNKKISYMDIDREKRELKSKRVDYK